MTVYFLSIDSFKIQMSIDVFPRFPVNCLFPCLAVRCLFPYSAVNCLSKFPCQLSFHVSLSIVFQCFPVFPCLAVNCPLPCLLGNYVLFTCYMYIFCLAVNCIFRCSAATLPLCPYLFRMLLFSLVNNPGFVGWRTMYSIHACSQVCVETREDRIPIYGLNLSTNYQPLLAVHIRRCKISFLLRDIFATDLFPH